MEEIPKQEPANCLKIVLFGPESTGKTTLAKQLAQYFKTQWVPEYMRTYLQKKWDETKTSISKDDLLPIAIGQMNDENKYAAQANHYLFCDTNLLELKVYCQYYYEGYCPDPILIASLENQYDYYLLTDIDLPWEADDLRDRPYDRSTLFRKFEAALQQQDVPYSIVSGNAQDRLETAIAIVKGLNNC